jgi:hypothetical protein
MSERIPEYEAEYDRQQWKMFPSIDRVRSPAEALTPKALAHLKQVYEYRSNHARRLGEPQEYSARPQWARRVPMVLA